MWTCIVLTVEKKPSVYRFAGVQESMPKNPLDASNEGFRAMQQRLAGAKKNKPMKPPKARPKASADFVKSATAPTMKG